MNETVIPMRIEGGEIQVKASVGQTVIKVVAPDEYSGATTVTPSDETQVLQTKDKTVRSDITVNPAPTETLSTTSNGTFTPSDDNGYPIGYAPLNEFISYAKSVGCTFVNVREGYRWIEPYLLDT